MSSISLCSIFISGFYLSGFQYMSKTGLQKCEIAKTAIIYKFYLPGAPMLSLAGECYLTCNW